jgi:autotransporter-associated beta strand protein
MPILVSFQDGSVKSYNSSTGAAASGGLKKFGAGTLILANANTYAGSYRGGVYVAAGDLDGDGIQASRISLLSLPDGGGAGVVDARDADAASKVKMLFNARSSLGLANTLVISIPQNSTPQSFRALNHLRQAQAGGRKIEVMEFFVNDARNPKGVAVKLEDVMITSYQTGGSGDCSISINYTKIEFKNVGMGAN